MSTNFQEAGTYLEEPGIKRGRLRLEPRQKVGLGSTTRAGVGFETRNKPDCPSLLKGVKFVADSPFAVSSFSEAKPFDPHCYGVGHGLRNQLFSLMDIPQRAEEPSATSSGGSSHIPTPPATQSEDTSNDSEDSFGYANDEIVKVPLNKVKQHFK